MPRRLRVSSGGFAYHVLNRAVARERIFRTAKDYEAFEKVLREAKERLPMRLLGWCLLPNTGIWCCGRVPTAICRSSCDG